jgi:hypothetical protein
MNTARKATRRGSIGSPMVQESLGDETNYSHVPEINGLEYEVEYSDALKKVTLEDLRDNAEPRRREKK